MSKQLLLIDGDHILHRCCAACEHEDPWDDENRVLVTNVEEAWDTLDKSLKNTFEHFGETNHVIAMGSGPYFRHTLHPEYKGGRGRKPLGYFDVKQRLTDTYNVVSMPGIEADDVMGILATKPNKVDKIIVAKDKDMKSIPAKIWDGSKFKVVGEAEADYWHLYQTLIGDTTDHYPGCPGVGPESAKEFLDEPYILEPYEHELTRGKRKGQKETRWNKKPLGDQPIWDGVVSLFLKAGLSAEEALKQARVARILRWDDWDSENKRPILWTPGLRSVR